MPYNNPKGIIAASVILELISSSCVVARFLARRKQKPFFGIDDWLILASLIGATGLAVMEIYGVAIGVLGRPLNVAIEDPRAIGSNANKAKHIELGAMAVGIPTLGLIKISISFLYRRIFGHKTSFRRVIDIWIVLMILWTVAYEITGLAECGSHLKALFGTPIQYLHRCGSAIPAGYAMVGSSIASDFITLLIPLPMADMVLAHGVSSQVAAHFDLHDWPVVGIYHLDGILTITGFTVWNLIEAQVGIVAACAILLRPLFQQILPTDSLKSLVVSIRRRVSNTRLSSKTHRLGSRDVSDEELVSSRPHMGPAESKAVATHGSGSEVAKNEGKVFEDGIYVKKQIEVEHV
ncbi:MAG: hypothetical protein Q9162_002598 [Coniocarpon cinnabarinum]